MSKVSKIVGVVCISLTCLGASADETKIPIIVGHRGASAYLPEDTLISVAGGYLQYPDYLKFDTSMTKDGKIVIAHDIYLDYSTNIKEIYPNMARADGHIYINDLTLDEIKKLTARERTKADFITPAYPDRFPVTDALPIGVPTLDEMLILIRGLDKSTGHNIGVCIDPKGPGQYADKGHEFAKTLLEVLAKYGYKDANSKCYVNSFDPKILKYIKYDLHSNIKLVQSVYDNVPECPDVDYSKMLTKEGLKEISTYACGVDPAFKLIFIDYGKSKDFQPNDVVRLAHDNGLIVRAWTLRKEDLPAGVTYDEFCDVLFKKAKVDAVHTDSPDLGVNYVKSNFKKFSK